MKQQVKYKGKVGEGTGLGEIDEVRIARWQRFSFLCDNRFFFLQK